MLAVGRLVRIEKTMGDKVINKSRFYNTFNYLAYEKIEREVGDWRVWVKSGSAEVRDVGVLTGKSGKFCGTSPAFYQVTTESCRHLQWV